MLLYYFCLYFTYVRIFFDNWNIKQTMKTSLQHLIFRRISPGYNIIRVIIRSYLRTFLHIDLVLEYVLNKEISTTSCAWQYIIFISFDSWIAELTSDAALATLSTHSNAIKEDGLMRLITKIVSPLQVELNIFGGGSKSKQKERLKEKGWKS